MRPARRGAVPGLVIVLAVASLLAVGLGTVWISPVTTLRLLAWKLGLAGLPADVPSSAAVILFELRIPRVLLAMVVGAALAASGAVFQALFRNPMADPAIIGVSSGAALGAIAVIILGGGVLAGGLGVPAAAFAGALAVSFLVYRLARIGPAVQVATLLLAGIAVAAVISAVISLVMAFAGQEIRSIYFWLLGGLAGRGWGALATSAPLVGLGAVLALTTVRDLNLMALGEERAAQLGVEIERFKRRSLATGALLAAAAVSVAGVIGFVGLMTPHILRLVLGADHRRLVPASIVAGAAFMVLADLAARTVRAPEEIPVGAVTALLGGPFFLYLLRRERKGAGARA
ncbi:MAG: FecCD family ABC transporter permease [Actinomycetota bacterium]